jgi:hypothetical protein
MSETEKFALARQLGTGGALYHRFINEKSVCSLKAC